MYCRRDFKMYESDSGSAALLHCFWDAFSGVAWYASTKNNDDNGCEAKNKYNNAQKEQAGSTAVAGNYYFLK
jgi:hypothetical protein